MNKQKLTRDIIDAWKVYNKFSANRYCVIYEDNGEIKYRELLFRANNFFHLTGIKLNIYADIAVKKIKKSTFTDREYHIEDPSAIIHKMSIFNSVPTLFTDGAQIGTKVKPLRNIDYIIGRDNIVLGFVLGNKFDNPSSLLNDDWDNIATNSRDILLVVSGEKNSITYDKLMYRSKDYSIDKDILPKDISRRLAEQLLSIL